MEAATWTAIGLLAAISVGSLFYLGSRIDALSGLMDGLGARLDGQGASLGARLDTLSAKMEDHMGRHAG